MKSALILASLLWLAPPAEAQPGGKNVAVPEIQRLRGEIILLRARISKLKDEKADLIAKNWALKKRVMLLERRQHKAPPRMILPKKPKTPKPKPPKPKPVKPKPEKPKKIGVRTTVSHANSFEVVAFDMRFTKKTHMPWWDCPWKLTLRNKSDRVLQLIARIKFFDGDGFIVQMELLEILYLQPGGKRVFTGVASLMDDEAPKVTDVEVIVTLLP